MTGQPRLVDGRIVFALYEIQKLGGGGREGMVLFPGQYMTGDALRLKGTETDSGHRADGDSAFYADDEGTYFFHLINAQKA